MSDVDRAAAELLTHPLAAKPAVLSWPAGGGTIRGVVGRIYLDDGALKVRGRRIAWALARQGCLSHPLSEQVVDVALTLAASRGDGDGDVAA